MEIEDREEEWVENKMEDFEPGEESLNLPAEWLYSFVETEKQMDQSTTVLPEVETVSGESEQQQKILVPDQVVQKKSSRLVSPKPKKGGWGPLQPERKSKRVPQEGISMLERAQAVKRKNNLEIEKGKKVSKPLSVSSMLDIADNIDIIVPAVE